MKSAREERHNVLEKRGLKTLPNDDSDSDYVEVTKAHYAPSTDDKLNEKKTEKTESTAKTSKRNVQKKKKKESSPEQKKSKRANPKAVKDKENSKLKEVDTNKNMATRSKAAKQMKITDSLKLSGKSTKSSKSDKKTDLIIPLRLENEFDNKVNQPKLNADKENEAPQKKPTSKKVDFASLNLANLDYSLNTKVYFNFKDMIEKSKDMSKVNVILAMAEIALNQHFYGLQDQSTKAYSFWNAVKSQQFFSLYFCHFTAETLRKYWREISSVKNIETLIAILQDKKDEIDCNEIKLLPLIKLLKDHINNDSTALDELLLGLESKKPKPKKEEDESHLKKKRFRPPQKQEPQEIAASEDIDPLEVYKILDNAETTVEQTKEVKNISLNDKFNAIAEIVDNFKTVFKDEYNSEFILDALKLNSMDIQKTYEFLRDPNSKKEHIFNEFEDNIILNSKNTKLYQGLVKSKGEKAVKKREEFLKNEA